MYSFEEPYNRDSFKCSIFLYFDDNWYNVWKGCKSTVTEFIRYEAKKKGLWTEKMNQPPSPRIVSKYAGIEQFFNSFRMLIMLMLVQSVGVIIIRILRTNVCKTNFTSLVFHFQLPQLGRTQLWGFPHFPTWAFYSHNAVFSHTSFKWFPGRRKGNNFNRIPLQPFCFQSKSHYLPICTDLMVYLYLYLFAQVLI